ncbi:MAG: glycosyltransferase family 1 protein, partial [Sulfitobacter sp.]|nr:glycosyltransferase family 1 protein [Sulfitobacter sp.]
MKLAFYAPMKSPDHPIPSGDRTIARNLMAALNFAGAEVTLSSTFNCREGKGEAAAQTAILQAAQGEAEHLIAAGKAAGWQAWISYHNYYKAPDLLGPTVTQALGIPYVQIESTRARKRLGGPWDLFARQAEAAAEQASLIFYFTERDAEALAAYAPPGQKLCHLKPFLRRTEATYRAQTGRGIISVGMMRARDK